MSDQLGDAWLSSVDLISSRLLSSDLFGAIHLAAASEHCARTDAVRLRQLLVQLQEIRRASGVLDAGAVPAMVFDALVHVTLSLGAIDEAQRLVCGALTSSPLEPFLQGVLGLVRRAQGRLVDAEALSTAAVIGASRHVSQPNAEHGSLRRWESVVDWDAQLRALAGDLSAIGRFAHFRNSIAPKVHPQPGSPQGAPLIAAPGLGAATAPAKVAVVEHFGLGDRLMFARFYGPLADSMPGSKITVVCHPLLTKLYRSSFEPCSDISFVSSEAVRVDYGPDAQLPAPAIPERLGLTNIAALRGAPGVRLKPSREAVQHVRTRLTELGLRGRIAGLAWRDSLRWYQPHRFVPLSALATPLAAAGFSLIALDPLVDLDEVDHFRRVSGIRILTTDQLPVADVDDLAALMTILDRIVTIDKVFANLAGALGLSADVFLSTFVDYRWTAGPGDSPVYPGVTLHRQRSYGDWSQPLEQFARSL